MPEDKKGGEVYQNLKPHQKDQIELYLNLLEKWRKRFNITGFRTRRLMYLRGIRESFLLSPYILKGAFLLDVGSGAGIPAIPLKILRPDLKMVLLEPRKKKWSFLQSVIRQMGWSDVRALKDRVESGPLRYVLKGTFDVVTARAFVSPEKLPSLAGVFLKNEGQIIAFTSHRYEGEPPQGWDMELESYSIDEGDIVGKIVILKRL